MSEYMQKQRSHLRQLLQALSGPDVEVYMYRPQNDNDSTWGIIYHKPTNTILDISYEGVNGVSLGTCLKPNKIYGTGYSVLDTGYRWITRQDIAQACELGRSLLMRDLVKQSTDLVIPLNTADRYGYKDLQEYFQKAWPNDPARFEKISA